MDRSNPAFVLSPWSEGVADDRIRLELKHALEQRLNSRLTPEGQLPDAHVDLFATEGGGLPVFKGTGIKVDFICINTRINVKLLSGDEVWMMPDPSLAWTALRVLKAGDDPSSVPTTQEMEEALMAFQATRVQSVCLCLCVCVCVCVYVSSYGVHYVPYLTHSNCYSISSSSICARNPPRTSHSHWNL
jgi:hypothetical protein